MMMLKHLKITRLAFALGCASVAARAASSVRPDERSLDFGPPTVEILEDSPAYERFSMTRSAQVEIPSTSNSSPANVATAPSAVTVPVPLPAPALPPSVPTSPPTTTTTTASPPPPPYNASNAIDDARNAVGVARDIVNLGKEVWSLVDNNRPTIDNQSPFDSHSASAVPEGIKSFAEMAQWRGPRSALMRVHWANLWNAEIATFVYRITYYYGGSYHGQGRYLKNVTVIPEYVSVSWGFNFTSAVSVVDPVNYGSETDPLAGLQLVVSYSLQSAMKKETGRCTHVVRGDGAIQNLSRVCQALQAN